MDENVKYNKSDIRYWKPHQDNPLVKQMLDDWGKGDIYGPWSIYEQKHDELYFYKSYYLISYGDEQVNIETLKIDNDIENENIILKYFKKLYNRKTLIPSKML